MRYTRVFLESIGYELAPVVVTSAELEARLAALYRKLHIPAGQLQALTGIAERRWWEPGFSLARGAAAAAKKALAATKIVPDQLGSLIYGGVCREHYEPATACQVASELGVDGACLVYDVSNACLGVMNGIVEIANRIELGQMRAGLVVSCESAREIVGATVDRMLANPTMDTFKDSIATLTGGSGAVAVVLSDGSFDGPRRRLLGGAAHAAPQHHGLCRWGVSGPDLDAKIETMRTDSVAVLKFGVELGQKTWHSFLTTLGWTAEQVDKVICHQVGAGHQKEILKRLGLDTTRDFTTFEHLGNIGTVSLPLTAAMADEREFLQPGDRVGFLGIGSGLNCMMLGVEW